MTISIATSRTSHEASIARLNNASYGASTLANLILADLNAETNRADSDTPDTEPQPFAGNTRHGLFAALNLCLHEIGSIAETLQFDAVDAGVRP